MIDNDVARSLVLVFHYGLDSLISACQRGRDSSAFKDCFSSSYGRSDRLIALFLI